MHLPRGAVVEVQRGAPARSTSSDGPAAAGAESRALLGLWRPALGGLPQPASADAAGRGGPVHAGRPALPDAVVRAVSAGVSSRGRRGVGAAARRIWARRDCLGWTAALPRASKRARDSSGVGAPWRGAGRANRRAPPRALRGVGRAAADRPPAITGPTGPRGRRGAGARRDAAGRRPRGALGDPRLPERRAAPGA